MATLKTLLSLTASDLTKLLIADSSLRQVEAATGIDKGTLSRIAAGMRTNEEHYRTLAIHASRKKLF